HEMRSLTAHALRAIIPTFGTMLGAMLSLAPLAAVVAFVSESALRAARATMPCSALFSWHARLSRRFRSAARRDGAFRRCALARPAAGALVRALPLGRPSLPTPLFAAAPGAPPLDQTRLLCRPGRWRRGGIDSGPSRRRSRGIGCARLRCDGVGC